MNITTPVTTKQTEVVTNYKLRILAYILIVSCNLTYFTGGFRPSNIWRNG